MPDRDDYDDSLVERLAAGQQAFLVEAAGRGATWRELSPAHRAHRRGSIRHILDTLTREGRLVDPLDEADRKSLTDRVAGQLRGTMPPSPTGPLEQGRAERRTAEDLVARFIPPPRRPDA